VELILTTMKRLTARRRNWFAHRRRNVVKSRLCRDRRDRRTVELHAASGEIWTVRDAPGKVSLPTVMCFNDNCPETISAIAGLRNNLRASIALRQRSGGAVGLPKPRKLRMFPSYRNFETITLITPAAALVVAAEYERFKILTGTPPLAANARKWAPEVFVTLWEIGFFEIVGFPQGEHRELPGGGSVKVLRMQSGETADANEITRLIEGLKQLYPSVEQSFEDGMVHLYGALIEAVGNVCGHAYRGGRLTQSVARWWMTGAVDSTSRRTTAVIYDQGVSIPISLPNWTRYAGFLKRFTALLSLHPDPEDPRSDGQAIAIAVEESVSSTGEAFRGHGLAQMKNFVDLCRDGYLRIMSRNGEVIFRPGTNPIVTTHSASIGGTLIEWNVSL
jgi:hypothetical protein